MEVIRFIVNPEEDIKNIIECWDEGSFKNKDVSHILPLELYELLKGQKPNIVRQIVTDYVENYYKQNSQYISKILKIATDTWQSLETEYIQKLELLTGKSFKLNGITACATLARRCPYNYKKRWFMFYLLAHPLQVNKICAHEIMHMHILNEFSEELEKLNSKDEFALLEALTVLLNQIKLSDTILAPDKGYEQHKALRSKVTELWLEKKDFDVVLKDTIKVIQHNGSHK
jgi:hypothetical protein